MSRSLDFGEKNVRILLNPDVKIPYRAFAVGISRHNGRIKSKFLLDTVGEILIQVFRSISKGREYKNLVIVIIYRILVFVTDIINKHLQFLSCSGVISLSINNSKSSWFLSASRSRRHDM